MAKIDSKLQAARAAAAKKAAGLNLTREEFCALHGISLATYSNYRRAGLGPEVVQVGKGNIQITAKADTAWEKKFSKRVVRVEWAA